MGEKREQGINSSRLGPEMGSGGMWVHKFFMGTLQGQGLVSLEKVNMGSLMNELYPIPGEVFNSNYWILCYLSIWNQCIMTINGFLRPD